ncbi:MAG: thioredoxin domain-containing protein [Trichlorobacter sp.]|uniref:thioredoxin domain-containing protein n=1 Tax=Trichlorobacter sp. TaxID=2911007 RepID=UPI00255E510A|nr:thioredoxin domain-containing protein [Trichlorobacter sp.]MDK9718510.1 thioredoxin domain-containing protein [Trichlorobacter sp.]
MTNQELHDLLSLDRSTLAADGRPEFNRLIFSRSPYLLQHSRNPVDWREWGPAAQEEAQQRNLPLFVSIGYATCHWCHVMAHESFEDDEVADILNHAFVPVKVDREERPDLDEFCMAACQTMTGSGGWPLNCFLKPDGTPFYALTYLPKEPRHGMPGFLELLENIAKVWQHKQDAVERNAASLMEALAQMAKPPQPAGQFNLATIADQASATLRKIHDPHYHGFGKAPKFPMPPYLLFLLHRPDAAEQKMALDTLKAMRQGGIWDQLGGGIHRYSTDQHWLVPHFEKMLYDQALVAYAALEAHVLTAESNYLEMADNLLEFVLSELTAPEGGFYCGLDADSEGREGACYVWKKQEIEQILGDEAPLFCNQYGVTDQGNFEEPGENVLFQALPVAEEPAVITSARQKLLQVRATRQQPLRDIKILSGWNGLTIAALARGAALTGNQRWLEAARRAAAFISSALTRADGRMLRSWCGTPSTIPAFLEDYAFLGWGYLELYQAEKRSEDLQAAEQLCRDALQLFTTLDGRLVTAGTDQEQLPLALSDNHDGVIPSGPAALAMNLVTLAGLSAMPEWQNMTEEILAGLLPSLIRQPISGLWLLEAQTLWHGRERR